MSKWMPPKPHFYNRLISMQYSAPLPEPVITEQDFNYWWDKQIKPLFENAMILYGYRTGSDDHWVLSESKVFQDTHTAVAIKIKPIKEESAEDLLRELVYATENAGIIEYKGLTPPFKPCLKRAKAFLEQKK